MIIVNRLDRVRALSGEIERAIDRPDLVVQPWQEFAKSFYTAMKADKMGDWIMIFIIILLVAIGVLNTVLMSVLERQREYGVLKALGTRPRQILSLVVCEIDMLAILSIAAGSGIAYGANKWLSLHGLTLSEPFSYGGMTFQTLYSTVNLKSFLVPGLAVLAAATLMGLPPAIKAARTVPAKTMRAV